MLEHLHTLGEDETFFGAADPFGVAPGVAGARSGRSSGRRSGRFERLAALVEPGLREQLNVLTSWGPFPVQPPVVRRSLPDDLENGLREGLLGLTGDDMALSPSGFVNFAPVNDAFYAPEAERLRKCAVRERAV